MIKNSLSCEIKRLGAHACTTTIAHINTVIFLIHHVKPAQLTAAITGYYYVFNSGHQPTIKSCLSSVVAMTSEVNKVTFLNFEMKT